MLQVGDTVKIVKILPDEDPVETTAIGKVGTVVGEYTGPKPKIYLNLKAYWVHVDPMHSLDYWLYEPELEVTTEPLSFPDTVAVKAVESDEQGPYDIPAHIEEQPVSDPQLPENTADDQPICDGCNQPTTKQDYKQGYGLCPACVAFIN